MTEDRRDVLVGCGIVLAVFIASILAAMIPPFALVWGGIVLLALYALHKLNQ